MELDELKALIQDRMERVQQPKSQAEFVLLLGKKTHSVAEKIRRNLLLEMIISVVFVFVCLACSFLSSLTSMRVYFGVFTVICILFIPLLYILYNKTKKLTGNVMPLKSNVQALIDLITQYTKLYFRLTMALIPISLIMATSLLYLDYNASVEDANILSQIIDSPLKITVIVLYFTAFFAGMYYFTRWYLKKLYGNYVLQLKGVVKELDESMQ